MVYDGTRNMYFIHYPVSLDWYPSDDKRIENQIPLVSTSNTRTISLDPGVRKFLVGYDPAGSVSYIGDKASYFLSKYLYDIDKLSRKQEDFWLRDVFYMRVKNLVNELHWKTINFLVRNYDTILYPDYRVSQMIKGSQLPRIVKRLMYMFSSYSFKQKLIWKCKAYRKNLVIVDESYTSKTCGICGLINGNLGGLEVFCCKKCRVSLDRDAHAARNILIKNSSIRCV